MYTTDITDINHLDYNKILLTPAEQQKAHDICDELAKTFQGQKEIIKQASQTNKPYVDYLFMRCSGIINRTLFWLYGSSKMYIAAAKSGRLLDDLEYAYALLGNQSHFLEEITGNGKHRATPYETFDFAVYDPENTDDLIKKFIYWYNRYLRFNLRGIAVADRKKTNIYSDVVDSSSPIVSVNDDDTSGNIGEGGNLETIGVDNTDELVERMTLESFIKKLEREPENSTLAEILKIRYNGTTDDNYICNELNLDPKEYKKLLKKGLKMYKEFTDNSDIKKSNYVPDENYSSTFDN